ncbi:MULTISPECIES: long-chain-fatty-acid--CoA ligase [Alcaligenes]|uniref:long-chain-fatty-acid--CoA ligase n=1 Tax=Alcaligenes TaxID=507 RepID=UPI0002AA9A0E|nr:MULTISPECIES: long-chain-fatty-acid--CoA ligase [Alcaligenes]EKU28657.1 acyl-CoA synthetase [Alcaligenes sp. HPC1271]ERT55721.1 long-chain fatty acid--CoA ligase [Alcaligenes sp. EGD-AK7]HRO20102.1 long-chain-fatty-acid--CoA ligase [Alcaligenes phenolicus]HRP13797.1 long-chain-fatty-acid--CoA ligase [Alcaligenes phenolicus]
MDKVWLQNYPAGIPATIEDQAQQYSSLLDVFEQSCTEFAQRTAYISMGKRMSYRELSTNALALASWLQSQGVKKGDRVALMMPNMLQYPISLYGVLRSGATIINTNPLYTARELRHQLQDSGAETIIIAENFAHVLQEILHETPIKRVIVTSVGDCLGGFKGWLVNQVVRHIKKGVPAWSLPGSVSFKAVLAQGRGRAPAPVKLTHDDIACLQYTGGTTGVAKGAILTHGNLVSNLSQALSWIRPYLREGQIDCVVTALPLYHIFAFTANLLVFLRLGAENLLIINARDIPSMIKDMSKLRFTAITGVNTLFNAMLNNAEFRKLDFSSLRFTLGGGMAVQEVVAKRWLEATGKPLAQAYGLTETSPAATINPLDKKEFTGSIGLPVPSTDIRIRDENQNDLPLGETGELCIRGPQVTPGYWQRPDETAKVFDRDGFLRTGDIGYMDEQGYVFLLDRKKDMILVSGFNVYPNEVEAVAAQHPDIVEAAAVGVPDEKAGEIVKLYVISRNPELTEKDVIAFCRKELTGYKAPRIVEFRDDLPRTNVGKILRRELRP